VIIIFAGVGRGIGLRHQSLQPYVVIKILVLQLQMMQDAHVKLNPGFPCQKVAINKNKTRCQETGLIFEEETNKVLHMEHRFVWC
jgi:hypothetical protein